MWCPVGYSRFEEVTSKLFERLSDYPDGETALFLEEVDNGFMWTAALDAFVLGCPSLSVCSPDGKVLRISPKLLQRRYCQVNAFGLMFVDADTWTVEIQPIPKIAQDLASSFNRGETEISVASGVYDDEMEDLLSAADDERFHSVFRNFSGWAVMCLEQDAPGHATPTDQMLDYFADSSGLSLKQIVQRIVADYDSNGQVVRDEAHRQYCPDIKREAFRVIWALAADQRPELSRRGPKRMKIKG